MDQQTLVLTIFSVPRSDPFLKIHRLLKKIGLRNRKKIEGTPYLAVAPLRFAKSGTQEVENTTLTF